MHDIKQLYRDFHKIPEYGDKLPLTKRLLCERLEELGIEYTTFEAHDCVIADIVGALPGKTVAYRADMDALHVDEATGLEYASTLDDCMHACGHDAHVAIALCAAERLLKQRDKLHGKVRFLFEAGEEIGVGAKHLIDENALDGVDAVFGLHVGTLAGRDVKSGTFVVLPGAVTAAKDKFKIKINGCGGHGAYPCEAIDPIRISASLIGAIQSIVSMEVPSGNGAVITFGSIHGGVDNNSIPDTVELSGTIRTQDKSVRELIRRRIAEITETLPRAFGGSGVCELKYGSEPVMNNPALASLACDVLTERFGSDEVIGSMSKALMGSDDFARLAAVVPGVYFFLSTSDSAKSTDFPNHNPRFAIDEDVLGKAADGVSDILFEYTRRNS